MPRTAGRKSLPATGRADRQSLPLLQTMMKRDPGGYEEELLLLRAQFDSSLDLFRHCSVRSTGDPAMAHELGNLALFLSHVIAVYPSQLAELPAKIAGLLSCNVGNLPTFLRHQLVLSLILLVNQKIISLEETMELFTVLQMLGDRTVQKLAFTHIIQCIRRMNKKHKNEAQNRKLQNIIFNFLKGDDKVAKRALSILCNLHRRAIWVGDRTADAICGACLHPSSRIMVAALSFLLDEERIENEDSSDESDDEGDDSAEPQVLLSKEDVYKAHHKGTAASKKKKHAKIQRIKRNLKRQQRKSLKDSSAAYSPLTDLKDPQDFVEKLFSRLRKSNDQFKVKVMMLKVICRTVGLHRLILLNLYPFLQLYAQPHQNEVTTLLAAAVQACHDMVPPDAVQPLFKQIVNQFINDRTNAQEIAVGLNTVREICLRIPLLMNEELLQDLVLYKKSHEKAVSIGARSLITLFREICPSLLVKKDRGRPVDPNARPKAYGEVNVPTEVPGLELLREDVDASPTSYSDDDNGSGASSSDDDIQLTADEDNESVDGGSEEEEEEEEEEEDVSSEEVNDDDANSDEPNSDGNDSEHDSGSDDCEVDEEDVALSPESCDNSGSRKKRKYEDLAGKMNSAEASLRALKKMAAGVNERNSSDKFDTILSDEDFRLIKKRKAEIEAKRALARSGILTETKQTAKIKIPSSEDLSRKRVDPASLEAHVKVRLSKEERLAMVMAGREDRGVYKARTAVKQKKTGGLSNRQKEKKKAAPLAAMKARAARSRQARKKKQSRSGKQFRGRKAWK